MSARPRELSSLLASAPAVNVRRVAPALDVADPAISGVAFDSRSVNPGDLFFAVRGEHLDGHDFVHAAATSGAAAVVVDHEVAVEPGVTQIIVDDTVAAMGWLAASFFAVPSDALTMVGITGTNGKTTTAHIIECALGALGVRTGVIGTLSGSKTTPEATELQRRLADFRDDGYEAVAMEVSSHALALGRVIGTRFSVGIFTNLGRDHLDLHGTEEQYFAAKARLFTPSLSARAVVNIDDVHGRLLVDTIEIPVSTFEFADAEDVEIGAFEHSYTWRGVRVRVGLGGRFNVMNSLAAATALEVLGHSPNDIAGALAATTPVRGRFEPVDAGQDFAVVVDYAHTPDALAEVLVAARDITTRNGAGRRVILVFGCGGDRDRDKRPQMGLAAALSADQIVVTSDNPRSEDPAAIINDIIEGVPADYRGLIAVEPDRREAIAAALRAAGSGDVVVIAGKGHETTQTFGSTVVDFDDRAVALELLSTEQGHPQ